MRFIILLCVFFMSAADASSRDLAYPESSWQLEDPFGVVTVFDQKKTTKPTVLFFWASWCPYCHKLMPGLQRVYDEFSDEGIDFYTINVWETGDAMAYIFDHDHTFPVLVEGESVAAVYGVKGTPALFVLDEDGKVVFERTGKLTPEQVEIAVIDSLIGLLGN